MKDTKPQVLKAIQIPSEFSKIHASIYIYIYSEIAESQEKFVKGRKDILPTMQQQ